MTDPIATPEAMPDGVHEALWQLFCSGPVRDGNLVAKEARRWLVKNGFAFQTDGHNALTAEGVSMAVSLGMDYRKDKEGAHP